MIQRPLDICLCTMDFVGPVRNGGIGTAYHALATTLKDAGHRVTVLYALGEWCERENIAHWIAHYKAQGIEFVPANCDPVSAIPAVYYSYGCYCWFAKQEKAGRRFDVIHFHEWRGLGFYSLLARRQGLAFANTVLCVGTHSPEAWHRWGMAQFVNGIEDLQIDHLERTSAQLADVLISPSAYMVQWMRDQDWKLCQNVLVRQNILTEYLPKQQLADPARREISEIVFFGRLERRKGLALFCDALDILCKEAEPPKFRVTFLGKKTNVDGTESGAYLESRARAWPFSWRIISDLDHAGAMNHLREPGRMAVIPSLMENSPYTLLECLGNGIACICSDLPGHRELVAPADADRVCFIGKSAALAAKLKDAAQNGITPAQPAIHPDETKAQWLTWHDEVAAARQPAAVSTDTPLVTVCMAHFNRDHLLRQAIESIRAQDYPNLQLVLVDDGSTHSSAIEYLQSIEVEFKQRNWKIIHQPNQYLGAARNAAARAADGQWLLFMDDDNVALPHEISTYVKAAQASGADILTCVAAGFLGDERPGPQTVPYYIWLPLGGALAVGVFVNLFGDANGLVKREVFEKVGGFTEDYGIGHEDWEFYAKAALAGYTVQVVPEILFWYRVGAASMLRTTNLFINHMRNLRPYEAAVRPELRPVLEMAQAMFLCPPSQIELMAPPPPSLAPAAPATPPPVEQHDFSAAQRLVDEYWNSLSWRLSGVVRAALARMCGMKAPQKPLVTSNRDAFIAIEQIRRSISWEATGPLRAVGRTMHAFKPKHENHTNNGA